MEMNFQEWGEVIVDQKSYIEKSANTGTIRGLRLFLKLLPKKYIQSHCE